MIRRILSIFSSPNTKRLVGEDQFGNRYFEVTKADGKIRRSVECENMNPEEYKHGMIPTQWEGWIRGSIKDPPTLKDLQDQELMRDVIAKRAAEIKQKDDEAQRKAYEDGLISRNTESQVAKTEQQQVGHASAPLYGERKTSTEPTSAGGAFEPGSWQPSSKAKLKPAAAEAETFEPESWSPNAAKSKPRS